MTRQRNGIIALGFGLALISVGLAEPPQPSNSKLSSTAKRHTRIWHSSGLTWLFLSFSPSLRLIPTMSMLKEIWECSEA
jgi:hypothetical protein